MPSSPATSAPPVSVVVRSMGRATLQRALQSVVAQTYRPIELVLVNARGAGHAPLPAAVEDLPVRPVADPAGQALRRPLAAQAGLEAATGEWVLFLDDDDCLLPGHLGRLVQAAHRHAGAPAVYADVELGREIGGEWCVQHRFEADFDPVRLRFENYLPIHAVLFRRTCTQQGLGFDTEMDLFEDWDFWLQLAQQGDFVRVPGVSARYVAGESGHSAVFDESPAVQQARERLFEKWRLRQSPWQHVQMLSRLQALFRQSAGLRDELGALQRGHAEQAAVLRAREAELAGAAEVLRAREAEIGSSQIEQQSQRILLTARERELANALAAIEAQQELLSHREREARDGVEYANSLRQTLGHREQELGNALQQIADLNAALAQKHEELDQQHEALDQTQHLLGQVQNERDQARLELAAREEALAQLHAERPWQALARTLRSKNKPHASRN